MCCLHIMTTNDAPAQLVQQAAAATASHSEGHVLTDKIKLLLASSRHGCPYFLQSLCDISMMTRPIYF